MSSTISTPLPYYNHISAVGYPEGGGHVDLVFRGKTADGRQSSLVIWTGRYEANELRKSLEVALAVSGTAPNAIRIDTDEEES